MKKINFKYKYRHPKGLNSATISKISAVKGEPSWMKNFRLNSLKIFNSKKLPLWGADLTSIDFNNIYYYILPIEKSLSKWESVPSKIKSTYLKLGIPQAEKNFLGGLSAQFESQVVYENLADKFRKDGMIFLDTDSALKKYPEFFKKYFGRIVPAGDNKFSALNSACWSGGSFIYVPKNVKVEMPLQAYFLINQKNAGQFERTLIIADEGSELHYIEGCTAPRYTTSSLHSAVVEVFVMKDAKVKYTTVQNWSKNVYNLTTKRALVKENGTMEWIDANLGSKATMKYPCCVLSEKYAKGQMLSISLASTGQHQDTGAKMIHLAPHTSSRIVSKSISNKGRCSYRGLVHVGKNAHNSVASVRCDALIRGQGSISDTYPTIDVKNKKSTVTHEATVEKIGEEMIYYLQTRGFSTTEAETALANGFFENIIKEIPAEYAIEMNRLLEIEMENAVG